MAFRLPAIETETSSKRRFRAYPVGSFHIDLAEVRTEQGKLCMLVAVDRTGKFAFVEQRQHPTFLEQLIEAVPYKVHTMLTDEGPAQPSRAALTPRAPAPLNEAPIRKWNV